MASYAKKIRINKKTITGLQSIITLAINCFKTLLFSCLLSMSGMAFAGGYDVYVDIGSARVTKPSYRCLKSDGQQVPDSISIWYTIHTANSGLVISANPSVISSGYSGFTPFNQTVSSGTSITPGKILVTRYAQGVQCSGISQINFYVHVKPVLKGLYGGNSATTNATTLFETVASVTKGSMGEAITPHVSESSQIDEICYEPLSNTSDKGGSTERQANLASYCEPEWPPYDPAPSFGSEEFVSDSSKPTPPEEFWWFNGQTPQNYRTSFPLTAHPDRSGLTFQWKVISGGEIVRFPNGNTTQTTNSYSNSLTAYRGSSAYNDIKVTVTVNGVESSPVRLTARKPSFLVPVSVVDYVNASYPYIWKTDIRYQIFDQFGYILPNNVPVNEKFTSGRISDYPGTNWLMPVANGAGAGPTVSPTNMTDVVARLHTNDPTPLIPTPLVVTNAAQLNMEKVMRFNGEFYVGGSYAGTGCRVQTLTWQLYRDHGRHINVTSPAPLI